MARPDVDGYFTDTFCIRSRFVQPFNGRRVDAMRDAIERDYRDSWMYPVLLTSLVEAADRVDSTTGVQMAYVKQWADRSYRPIELRVPELVAGPGAALAGRRARCGDDARRRSTSRTSTRRTTSTATSRTTTCGRRSSRGTRPSTTASRASGSTRATRRRRACSTIGARCRTRSRSVIRDVDAELVVVSYNNESWVAIDELEAACRARGGAVATLAFDSRRYVGAQIGIHDPGGKKVGKVSHLRNVEYVVCAGEQTLVDRIANKGDELWKLPATSRS